MADLKKLTKEIIAFRDARDWKQFHNPKDLALSLAIEMGEVLEHFQWKSAEDVVAHTRDHRDEIGSELADVLTYLIYLADATGVDLIKATRAKMEKNAKRYPVQKIKGKHTNKYDKS